MTKKTLLGMMLATSGLVAVTARATMVTRGPYLNTPTPTSMIVRWRTDFPTDSRVAYGPAPGSLSQTADDILPTTEHIVTLTGLTAGTQYYYSVGSTGGAFVGDDANHHFHTNPALGSRVPIRMWSIGDAGFTGAPLNAVRDAYKAFNGGVAAADLFLLLGDNAYVLATDAQYQAAVFNVHAEMLRTTPVWSTFGNHEAFSSNDFTMTGPYFDMFSFPTAGEAGGVASGTESYYSFDYANVHLIVLDSEFYTPNSNSGPMLTWLQADLAATTADWVIAFWHRPPYTKGALHNSDTETNEINMRQYVLPVLESYGVDLVLGGHSHNYERSYFLDGHYGLSTTFSSAYQVDAGDGDPAGDGAYRKADPGATPNAGAVYVVNGSGSEFRNATLNHPAHVIGLLETGSLVLDVVGDTLTGRFLTGAGAIHDQFRIVKGTACTPTPATGCGTAPKGRLVVKNKDDNAKDRFTWKWKGGNVDGAAVGDPTDQTDLAVCLYDNAGVFLGGTLVHGASGWKSRPTSWTYNDKLAPQHGLRKMKLKLHATKGLVYVKGQGGGLDVPSMPAAFPMKAQLLNVNSGACWESTFPTFRKNDGVKVVAKIP